ncbi:MAG: hypothetical protein V4576_02515, partial [Patescibacteria group bacterium]
GTTPCYRLPSVLPGPIDVYSLIRNTVPLGIGKYEEFVRLPSLDKILSTRQPALLSQFTSCGFSTHLTYPEILAICIMFPYLKRKLRRILLHTPICAYAGAFIVGEGRGLKDVRVPVLRRRTHEEYRGGIYSRIFKNYTAPGVFLDYVPLTRIAQKPKFAGCFSFREFESRSIALAA